MNAGGWVLIIAGLWVLAQILKGGLLDRIGV